MYPRLVTIWTLLFCYNALSMECPVATANSSDIRFCENFLTCVAHVQWRIVQKHFLGKAISIPNYLIYVTELIRCIKPPHWLTQFLPHILENVVSSKGISCNYVRYQYLIVVARKGILQTVEVQKGFYCSAFY